ncbi:hypothetical protein D3C73_1426100 [compost metagenome]
MDIAFGQELRWHLDIIFHLHRLLLRNCRLLDIPGRRRTQRHDLGRSDFPFLLPLQILAEMLACFMLQAVQNHFTVRREYPVLIQQAA